MQDESPSYHAFVYSGELVRLVRAANETAAFLEAAGSARARDFIAGAIGHLAEVYHAMWQVGSTEPVLDTPPEPSVSEQEWSAVYQAIARLLGPHNDILRPAGEDEFDRSELVAHTLSEDLSDLYQELKDFTSSYSLGIEEVMNDAAWELRERFTEHWGTKLLRALANLHELYASGTDPEET